MCSDLDSSKLKSSINNFHDTRYYLDQYIKTLKDFDFNKLDDKVMTRVDKMIKYLSAHFGIVDFVNVFKLRAN